MRWTLPFPPPAQWPFRLLFLLQLFLLPLFQPLLSRPPLLPPWTPSLPSLPSPQCSAPPP